VFWNQRGVRVFGGHAQADHETSEEPLYPSPLDLHLHLHRVDLLAYDNDVPYDTVVQELRGIKKHCEGLLAEKLTEAVTGERIPPPPKRKRTHRRNHTRNHKLATA
jgi:hypothetical protein